MSRLSAVLGILVLSILVLLWWLQSGADAAVGDRNRIFEKDGVRERAGRRDDSGPAPPSHIPRKESFEWLRIEYPPGDARARRGGPCLLSARGNLVVFRRRSPEQTAWVREVIPAERREVVVRTILAMPEAAAVSGAGFAIALDDGTGVTRRTAQAAWVQEVPELLGGQGGSWSDPAVLLHLAGPEAALPGSPAPAWPLPASAPAPAEFTAGPARLAVASEARDRILRLFEAGELVTGPDGGVFRLVAWEVVLPPRQG